MADTDSWQTFVLKTIDEKETAPGKGYGRWVLMRVKNGKDKFVKVLCGNFVTNDEGVRKYNTSGLNWKDFEALNRDWPAIKDLLQNPPPIPGPEPEPETKPDLEKAPF